jgi:hypothetical protein
VTTFFAIETSQKRIGNDRSRSTRAWSLSIGEGSFRGVRSLGVHGIEEQSLEHKYVERALLRGRLKGGGFIGLAMMLFQ